MLGFLRLILRGARLSSEAVVMVTGHREPRKCLFKEAITAYEQDKERKIDELIAHIKSNDFFFVYASKWHASSNCGAVTFESDTYGPEVKLLGSPHMLDCYPQFYRFEREQARRIYDALCDRFYKREIQI